MVSAERIELPSPASEAGVLPLDEAEIATLTGLEPVTSCVTGKHSNQLNYRAILMTDTGIEPIFEP